MKYEMKILPRLKSGGDLKIKEEKKETDKHVYFNLKDQGR
jgi:hypothetical protein